MSPPPARCDLGRAGFSLPEVLAALAIVGMAAVVAAGALTAQATAQRRLAVRQELLRLADAGLEAVRGGAIPLEPGMVNDPDLLETSAVELPAVVVDVRRGAVDDLWHVVVVASGTSRGEMFEIRLESQLWRRGL